MQDDNIRGAQAHPSAGAKRADIMKRITTEPRVACATFAKVRRVAVRAGRRQPVSVAGAGADVRFRDGPNPHYQRQYPGAPGNPETITLAWNSNESPLVRLLLLGTIDDAQARAGHHVRMLYERVVAGQGSPSFIQERVDGGRAGDIFSEGRTGAARQLKLMTQSIGEGRMKILLWICGEGRSLNEMARALRTRKTSVRAALLLALDAAAEWLGFGKPRPPEVADDESPADA